MNIKCEICGGNNIMRQSGAYVCQDCGIQYSKEDIQNMLGVGAKSDKEEDKPQASVSAFTIETQAHVNDHEKALKLYQQEKYNEAFVLFSKAADAGIPEAQYYLGLCYEKGRGVSKDSILASQWYLVAAKLRNPAAQNAIALNYLYGDGIQENYDEAFRWACSAVELGNYDALVTLGMIYEQGKGVPIDYEKAFSFYLAAAEQDNVYGMSNVGMAYLTGRGVSQDLWKAAYWNARAAEKGETKAQYNLGLQYIRGDGVDPDVEKAIEWLKRAAFQGHTGALEKLNSLNMVMPVLEKGNQPSQGNQTMIGKYVNFGKNPGNNPATEFLTWKVIDQSPDKLLLVTKYEIYAMAHCELPNGYCNWFNSDIRNHFLDVGINEIFSVEEQEAILLSDVKASHHPEREWTYQGKGEPDSQSKLFLLSLEEVKKYFPTEDERICGFDDGQGGFPWWLRTKGHRIDGMVVVGASGIIVDNGAPQTECMGVRPAMWVDYQKATKNLKLRFYDSTP